MSHFDDDAYTHIHTNTFQQQSSRLVIVLLFKKKKKIGYTHALPHSPTHLNEPRIFFLNNNNNNDDDKTLFRFFS